jgi:hypothetical protein
MFIHLSVPSADMLHQPASFLTRSRAMPSIPVPLPFPPRSVLRPAAPVPSLVPRRVPPRDLSLASLPALLLQLLLEITNVLFLHFCSITQTMLGGTGGTREERGRNERDRWEKRWGGMGGGTLE